MSALVQSDPAPAASVSTAAVPPARSPNGAGGTPLSLAASLDMTAALPLAKELIRLRGGAVLADASAVRRLGGQSLQVLIAAQALWREDGQPFEVVSPSPEFLDALDLMGAADLINVSSQELLP